MSHILKKKESKGSYDESKIRIEKSSQQQKPLKGTQSKKPTRLAKVTKSHKAIQ